MCAEAYSIVTEYTIGYSATRHLGKHRVGEREIEWSTQQKIPITKKSVLNYNECAQRALYIQALMSGLTQVLAST